MIWRSWVVGTRVIWNTTQQSSLRISPKTQGLCNAGSPKQNKRVYSSLLFWESSPMMYNKPSATVTKMLPQKRLKHSSNDGTSIVKILLCYAVFTRQLFNEISTKSSDNSKPMLSIVRPKKTKVFDSKCLYCDKWTHRELIYIRQLAGNE